MNHFQPDGFRSIDFEFHQSTIKDLIKYRKRYYKNIPPYPTEQYKGKGIVICAGGLRYFTCGWIAIKMLRMQGCGLPIELWHLGNEISTEIKAEMAKLGITCKDLLDFGPTHLTGCMLKPACIIKSAFKEVLFIDADNICISDPEVLFSSPEYKEHGALFWPDYWQTAPENPIWSITGTPFVNAKEQESGQMLINKEKCWKELNLTLHFNELNTIYHQLLVGDKDTFRFAWMTLNTPFYMNPKEPTACGYSDAKNQFLGTTMVQHDLKGEYFFLHRNLLKWDVTKPNERTWTKLKEFSTDARQKEYILKFSPNGHMYIDLAGQVEAFDPPSVITQIEDTCVQLLQELRSEDFYHRFVAYSHFASYRYRKDTPFDLDADLAAGKRSSKAFDSKRSDYDALDGFAIQECTQ